MIAEVNWRHYQLEVDIIAVKMGVIHIVEVKTRAAALGAIEQAQRAIDPVKRDALIRAAQHYMLTQRIGGALQFDLAVVEVHIDTQMEMHYFENYIAYDNDLCLFD